MLFSKDFLFIHVPKTGGMSITRWLLNNYMGEMYLCIQSNAFRQALKSFDVEDVEARVRLVPGNRHATLPEAKEKVEELGFDFEQFETIAGVARHPLDLEKSYYHHLRKPKVQARRPAAKPLYDRVNAMGFPEFLEKIGFHGNYPANIEEYFMLNGKIPDAMKILRLETLQADVDEAFGPYLEERRPLQQRNKSEDRDDREETLQTPPEWLATLRRKHPFLCELYDV